MPGAVVGVSTSLAVASWDCWTQEAAVVSTAYVHAIEESGGHPLLIPTLRGDANRIVERLDALVLSGGTDIDPRLYGEIPHPRTQVGPPERDHWELDLLTAALAADKPVLGICRGMQLINVSRNGTLIQHLPDRSGTDDHLPEKNGFGQHTVRFAPGSIPARALGRRSLIATHHHQAVAKYGTDVEPVGWADDGTIEAIELRGYRFVVGLQGHPEESAAGGLFTSLIESVASSTSARM